MERSWINGQMDRWKDGHLSTTENREETDQPHHPLPPHPGERRRKVDAVSLLTGKSPGRASREGREECVDIFRNKEIRRVEG